MNKSIGKLLLAGFGYIMLLQRKIFIYIGKLFGGYKTCVAVNSIKNILPKLQGFIVIL